MSTKNIAQGDVAEAPEADQFIESAKAFLGDTPAVQRLWDGDVAKALEDIKIYGDTRVSIDFPSGLDIYGGADESHLEFEADAAGNVSDIIGWHDYDTEKLLNAILSKTDSDDLKKLNDALRQGYDDGAVTLDSTKAKMEELRASDESFDMEPDTEYLGSGYIGPYAGSTEFNGNNGFEYIYLTDGNMLVRVGAGYATLDTEEWELFEGSAGDPDSFIIAITEDPRQEAEDMIGEHEGGMPGAEALGYLVELHRLVEGDIEADELSDQLQEISEQFKGKMETQRYKEMEDLGQQRLPLEEAEASLASVKTAIETDERDEEDIDLENSFDNKDFIRGQLADALGVPAEDLTDMAYEPFSGFGVETHGFQTGEKEYAVVKSDDAAIELAKAVVMEDLENEPGIFNQEWLARQMDAQRTEDFFRRIYDEWNRSYAEDIHTESSSEGRASRLVDELIERDIVSEEDTQAEGFDVMDHIEAFVENMTDDQIEEGEGGYTHYEFNFGKEEAAKMVLEHGLIDYDNAASNAVSEDGWKHFISRYDGNSDETTAGYVYWREN